MIDFLLWILWTFLKWVGEMVLKRFFSKTFIDDPKSPFHYIKLMEKLKVFLYGARVAVMVAIYVTLTRLGLIKPLTRGQYMKMAVIIVAALLLTTMIIVAVRDQRKKMLLKA